MFTSDYSMAGSGSLLHGLMNKDNNAPSGLSTSEGVAVGICVLLLGLVYAASVCVYIYVRRRRKKRKKRGGEHDE
jgi:beta-lactamase regulating signal transducer with metallopeptidase domain